MSAQYWGRGLFAALVLLLSAAEARAGDPAIAEPNGLFAIKLGYGQVGKGADGRVLNGVQGPNGFVPCTNNNCGGAALGHSETSGGLGLLSGFSGYGGTQAAAPLGHDFGVQFDGELGGIGGRGNGGGGDATVHLFRGDPAVGLVGPMINYSALGDAGYLRAALEGQFYWKDFTFYGNGGYQWANSGDNINVDSGVVGCGYVAFYPMDSVMLLAGGGGGTGEFGGFGEVEWQAFQNSAPGATFFLEGMAGTDDSEGAFAGFRYHFGAGTSLEMRHRHELPLRTTLCGFEQFTAPGATTLNFYQVE